VQKFDVERFSLKELMIWKSKDSIRLKYQIDWQLCKTWRWWCRHQ